MIAYRRKTRTWSKPPAGSQIDWSHSLAQGLAVCFLLNENGGSQVFDIVGGLSMPLTGTPAWSSGLQTASSSQYGVVSFPTALQLNPPATLIWQGRALAAMGSFSHIFGYVGASGSSRPFAWSQQGSTTALFDIVTNSGGSARLGGLTVSSTVSTQLAAVITQETATQIRPTLYLNGVLNLSATLQTGTSITYGTAPVISFNRIAAGPSFSANCSNDFGLIYSVAQSASNLQWLAAEPYDFVLTPMNTRYFFPVPATATGGSAALLPAM